MKHYLQTNYIMMYKVYLRGVCVEANGRVELTTRVDYRIVFVNICMNPSLQGGSNLLYN